MNDSMKTLDQLVQQFVSEHVKATLAKIDVTAIARDAVAGVLGGSTPTDVVAKQHATGVKRDPAVLTALTEQVFAYINANPGSRMEQISAALNAETKDLVLPVKKLIKDGKVCFIGNKRATQYFMGAKPPKDDKKGDKADKPAAPKPTPKPKGKGK